MARIAAGLGDHWGSTRRSENRHGASLLGRQPKRTDRLPILSSASAPNTASSLAGSLPDPTPRHRRRVVGAQVLKYSNKDNCSAEAIWGAWSPLRPAVGIVLVCPSH